MQVDLPQPVGPTRKTNSPRPIAQRDVVEPDVAAVVDLRDVGATRRRRGSGAPAAGRAVVRAGCSVAAIGSAQGRTHPRARMQDAVHAIRLAAQRSFFRNGTTVCRNALRPGRSSIGSMCALIAERSTRVTRRAGTPDWRASARAPLSTRPFPRLVSKA